MGKTHRVMLVVAYDGTAYHGWQYQPNCITIEGELNRCISELTGENIEVIGASRTDAGVHALGNIAVFDTCSTIPPDKIIYPLNQLLPEDIRIQESRAVEDDFHPRHCDTRKTYEYRILSCSNPIPTKRLYAYYTNYELNENLMQLAAMPLIGEHDFVSFCSVNTQALTTVRTIYDIIVKREGEEIVIRVTGNGFLYNMVRIIAGTLIEAGKGKINASDVTKMLEAKDRCAAGPTAPANGLMLCKYEFISDL